MHLKYGAVKPKVVSLLKYKLYAMFHSTNSCDVFYNLLKA